MVNRFFRHIKEGFFGVVRHGGMSASSSSAVSITLVIISVFALVTLNMENITNQIEGSVKISVIIDYSSESSIESIQNQIESIDGVKKVEYFSKDEEFDKYVSSFDEDEQAIFAPYKDDNPMHDSFYVEVIDGDQLVVIADTIDGIDGTSVEYGGDAATNLITMMNNVRFGGFILAIALSLLAIYLVSNTIRITIFARANEIWIMRNVGARNGYIRSPFLVEGIVIGILGSIIPILLTIFGYIYLYDLLGGIFLTEVFTLLPPHPFVLQLSLGLLILGVIVGFIGSYISVTKYLRWKR
jgi:cell division transport system permease protein